MTLIVVVVVLVMLAIALRLAIPRLGNSVAGGIIERDGRRALAPCPATPNCQQLEWPIQKEPSQVIDTVAAVIAAQPGARVITQNEQYLHASFSTPLMGFVDDVEFLVNDQESDGQPVLRVRSASRLGHSDLGANARRIESLQKAIDGQL